MIEASDKFLKKVAKRAADLFEEKGKDAAEMFAKNGVSKEHYPQLEIYISEELTSRGWEVKGKN